MEATIKIKDIKEALSVTIKVIPSKIYIPITSYIYFEFLHITDSEYNTLILKGSSPEHTITYNTFAQSLDKDFSFLLIDPSKLLSFINTHKDEDILKIKFDPKEEQLDGSISNSQMIKISVNKDKITLPVSLEFDAMMKDIEIDAQPITIDSYKLFYEDINKAKLFVSHDELRPIMNGVFIDNDNIISSDATSLFLKKDITYLKNKGLNVVLPTSFVNLLPVKNIDSDFKISFDNKFISIDLSYIKIEGRLIDGNFPNYNAILPTDAHTTLNINKSLLKNLVKKAMIFSNESSGLLTIKLTNTNLELLSSDIEFGQSFDSIIEHNGIDSFNLITETDTFLIGVKDKILLSVLNSIDEDDIEINIRNAAQAITITMKDSNVLYLVMPMMLNN